MKLMFWIVVVPAATVLALFAGSNREAVTLGLWPLPFAFDLPLYLAILGALLIGFISGAAAAWIAGRHRRRENRRRGRRIAALETELAARAAQPPGARETAPARIVARG
jgi:lipopolysaccharide assembly protein A